MGYNAESVEVNFTIPAAAVAGALAAVTERFEGNYESLTAAVEYTTCFQDCCEGPAGFALGWHNEKYLMGTDDLLAVLAPFADDGSYVRFNGEDGCLFGFQVVNGRLREESGDYTWVLDRERDPAPAPPASSTA